MTDTQGGARTHVFPSCPDYTYDQVVLLLNAVYEAGSPDANAALGKFDNLQHQLNNGNTTTAKERAWDIASFTIDKWKEGKLIGDEQDIIDFLNAVFCFAGMPGIFTSLENAWLIYPSDTAQTLVTNDGWAGVQVPALNVAEPTLLTIVRLDDALQVLATDLDQYPLNYDFHISNVGGTGWINPVVVGVCPQGGLDEDLNAALVLGHQGENGFELLDPADASFIDCSDTPLPATRLKSPAVSARLGAITSDTTVQLAIGEIGSSGVGGTADAFSPIAPVDPNIYGSAGVGGTADAFRPRSRIPTVALSLASGTPSTCEPFEAPIGTPVHENCRPTITFTTLSGTALDGIPVTWAVDSGGGTIQKNVSGTCSPFGTLPDTQQTSGAGVTSVCWTMGSTPGLNKITATAGLGGDAIAGVQFIYADVDSTNPGAIRIAFRATANPPSQLAFDTQPAAGSQIVAGTNIPVVVNVLDANGDLVLGYNGPVSVSTNQNSFSATSTTTVNAVSGVATFSNLAIETAATNYRVVAGATFGGNPVSTNGNLFDVVAAAPVTMTKVAGDNQTVAAGTAVPINPKVQVFDTYGNQVPGVTVIFTAQNNTAALTDSTPTTAADGTASVGSWTLLDGPNVLLAFVKGNALVFTTFNATGVTTLDLLNSCPLGGSGDPVSYPFWAPGDNKRVKQVELYLSSNGPANTPATYQLALDVYVDGYDQGVTATAIVNATLTGKTSEALPTVFRFADPVVSGNKNIELAFQIRVLTNPDDATLFYNTGPCGLGNCKPPKGCSVMQATAMTPYPLGDIRRKSVAIRILGHQ